MLILLLIVLAFYFKSKWDKKNSLLYPEGAVTQVESDESRTSILLISGEEKIKISTSSANQKEPFSRGDFIVWVDESQEKSEKIIVRYHVPTKTEYSITTKGSAQRPRVTTQGAVVWQEWENEQWHVYYFDGQESHKITTTTGAINPDISGQDIVYVRKNSDGVWQAYEYSLEKKNEKIIKEGIEAKYPYFYGKKLYYLDE